ncbi:MAG: thioredoxin family protein [Phycisphaerales bacterium]|nr:thioredoxin family protein [Phycisphaerales bacterium]
MKKLLPTILIVLVFGGYIAFMMLRKPAPTPGVFDARITLAEARQQSAESGKPILVLATADWCAPCQGLKRGALTDPAVVEFIREQTIPVYLEDGTNRAEIRELQVASYPTTLILKGGSVQAITGGRSADNYLEAIRLAVTNAG